MAAAGLVGIATTLAAGASALIFYYFTRARGVWGTSEPPLGVAEEVVFRSAEDGTAINGWYFRARGAGPGAAVVLCHGAWTGRRQCLPLALALHRAGFHVLAFDFRAHGASGGTRITLGYHEASDIIGAVGFLAGRPEVARGQIGVVGISMGAAAAIRAAARCPAIAAVVADSAFASFVDALRYAFYRVGWLPSRPLAALTLRWARWRVRADPHRFRPVDVVGQIAPRPLLIIHGQDDALVPVRHARQLYRAAGEPKALWILPGVRHARARLDYPDEYLSRVERFLRAALSAGAPAPPAQPAAVG